MTYFDFIGKKEHAFLRNIYKKEELHECKVIKSIENYYFHFQIFIQISLLLNDFYSRGIRKLVTGICDPSKSRARHHRRLSFSLSFSDSFKELYDEINKTQIKSINWSKKTRQKLYKIISYICMTTMNFLLSKFDIKTVFTIT